MTATTTTATNAATATVSTAPTATPSAKRRHSVSTGATIRYEGNSVPMQVRMLDFSATGAGFLMPELPEIGAAIVLSIDDHDESLELTGTIRWAQTRSGGWWRVGCHFSEPIADGFDFDNQQVVRETCQLPVSIRGDEAEESFNGTIVNHSEGGVCVRSKHDFAPGQTLMFTTRKGLEPTSFVARVQWTREDNGETIFGCQFTRPASVEAFQRLLENPIPRAAPDAPMSANDRAVWIGTGLTFTVALVYVLELWPL